MSTILELERQILAQSPADRERLATLAWGSLVADSCVASDPDIDQAGIESAAQRDAEIESGVIEPIDHAEFLRRTGGDSP